METLDINPKYVLNLNQSLDDTYLNHFFKWEFSFVLRIVSV